MLHDKMKKGFTMRDFFRKQKINVKAGVVIGVLVACNAIPAKTINLPEKFWNAPARPERFSSLSASWNGNSLNADKSLSSPLAGGFGVKAGIPGAAGNGVVIDKIGGYLHFRGEDNLNPESAVVRFKVKGKVWDSNKSLTLFSALRESYSIDIVKRKNRLMLVLRNLEYLYNAKRAKADPDGDFRRMADVTMQIDKKLDADKWYTVVAGWDIKKGEAFISLDGKGELSKMKFPEQDKREFLVFLIGGAVRVNNNPDGLGFPGVAFDELQIYNYPLDKILAFKAKEPAGELLIRTEQGVRKYFKTMSKLQRMGGGWQNLYTWPTLIGCEAQGRQLMQYDDKISNDKSRASAYVASQLIYGYELLNDYHCLDMARKCGDFYVAAQSPEGAWLYLYRVKLNKVEGGSVKDEYKLQDSCQSHPLYLLGYLYRITGEKKYLETMKKAGNFYLKAQNPDGSWSHHYNPAKQRGETCRSLPQGGEVNDLAMNDAIDVMILMYHFTKDRKYIDAIKRAGEWLLKAQLKGPVRGWADQYDNTLTPTWARNFEPPALSWESTGHGLKAMAELYRLSGDKRYRDAIVETLEWLKKTFPDNIMYRYHDYKNGRPIAATMDKVYYLDDPKQVKAYAALFRGKIPKPDKKLASFYNILDRAVYPVSEKAMNKADLPGIRKQTEWLAKRATNTQNEAGVWVYPCYSGSVKSVGAAFIPGQGRLMMQLRYIDAMRTMRGELPLKHRGGIYSHGPGSLKNFTVPEGWYNIPWEEK